MTGPVARKKYDPMLGKYIPLESKEDASFPPSNIPWKYCEDQILADLKEYLASTYKQHYKSDSSNIECFDAWIALGDSAPTFRNTALKYIWRYGKKNGNNKDDLLKALHYIFLMLYVEHYSNEDKRIDQET